MSAVSPFALPAGEQLTLLELPHPAAEPATSAALPALARSFEFSCRGDRVPLQLFTPEPAAVRAVLLVQPDPTQPGTLPRLDGLRSWLSAGVGVASITLPLFGSRRSPKMTEMLEQAVTASAAGHPPTDNARILWQEFTRQSVLELRRALDALEALRDGERVLTVFAAAGLAASVGAIFCAVDRRPAAALLSGPVEGGPDGADPAPFLGEIAPRRLHVEPETSGDLLDAAWTFLSPQLPASRTTR